MFCATYLQLHGRLGRAAGGLATGWREEGGLDHRGAAAQARDLSFVPC